MMWRVSSSTNGRRRPRRTWPRLGPTCSKPSEAALLGAGVPRDAVQADDGGMAATRREAVRFTQQVAAERVGSGTAPPLAAAVVG